LSLGEQADYRNLRIGLFLILFLAILCNIEVSKLINPAYMRYITAIQLTDHNNKPE
jgi:hypothetical protein